MLGGVAAANAALAVGQVIVGRRAHSWTVGADAAHQIVDVIALLLVLAAWKSAERPVTSERTFGWSRRDPLAAHISALLLLASLAWVAVEAVRSIGGHSVVDGPAVIAVGIVGLLVNGGGAAALSRVGVSHGHEDHDLDGHDDHDDHAVPMAPVAQASRATLGLSAATLHLLTDAFGSLLVVITGVVLWRFDIGWFDPVASLVLCALIVRPTWRLVRRSSDVLLDVVPPSLSVDRLSDAMLAVPGVEGVHHVHVWSIGSSEHALSAHVEVSGSASVHEAQELITAVRAALLPAGISHTTLQVECHPCGREVHGADRVLAAR